MWASKLLKSTVVLSVVTGAIATTAFAQSRDVSPVLLIETGPSDSPEYRRMTFTKYLSGDRVSVAYKSYTRSEFNQIQNTTSREDVMKCSRGSSSSLSDLESYERSEARRKRRGEAPEVKSFCLKNIPSWENGNRKRYLDPIFNGMPYARAIN